MFCAKSEWNWPSGSGEKVSKCRQCIVNDKSCDVEKDNKIAVEPINWWYSSNQLNYCIENNHV